MPARQSNHRAVFATSVDCAKIAPMQPMRRTLLRIWIPLLPVIVLLGLVVGMVQAQNSVSELLALINSARAAEGLHPYAISVALSSAAQRHSEDMAASGQIGHTGSDGSSSTQRILEAGYGVYEFGLVASQNIYGGTGGAQAPFDEWLSQPGARSNLMSSKYREAGIGFASDAQGRAYWTLTVGAQPNVLPVFINGGVTRVDSITVTLNLVPENVAPEGLGTAMGQPKAYRASTDAEFVGADWEPWAASVNFALEDVEGLQTVYVQLRDSEGRTTVSRASVTLGDISETDEATGTIEADVTATPSATSVSTAEPSETPTTSPEGIRTATATTSATPTPVPSATATPTPSATPIPATQTPTRPVSTATASPQPSQTPTPFPTITSSPVPPASPTNTPLPSATILATSPPAEVTPILIPPEAGVVEPEGEGESPSLASRIAPWALGLQIVALALGVYVALRRPSE
jgi:uncharacterized protein YkwD